MPVCHLRHSALFSPSTFTLFSVLFWNSLNMTGVHRAVTGHRSLPDWLQQTTQMEERLQHFLLNHFNYLPSIFRLSEISTLSTPSTHKLEQLLCSTCLELACCPSLDPKKLSPVRPLTALAHVLIVLFDIHGHITWYLIFVWVWKAQCEISYFERVYTF